MEFRNLRATEIMGHSDASKALQLHMHDRYMNGKSCTGPILKRDTRNIQGFLPISQRKIRVHELCEGENYASKYNNLIIL